MTEQPADEATAPQRWHRVKRVHGHLHRNRVLSATTKIIVTVIGVLVIVAGIIMLVAPGPGLVAIVAGLAILATEWSWAERWLTKARDKLDEARKAAMEMDPDVRRRRIILTAGLTALAAAAVIGYLVIFDWPEWAVDLWGKLQSWFGFLPDLPGM